MANFDKGMGLVPLFATSGGSFHVKRLTKDASQATAIFRGDVVQREADSFLAPGGTPGTDTYDGVSLDYGAALTLTDHLVVVDPNCVFDAQDVGSGAGLVVADEGQNCNFIFSAGNLSLKLSGHKLNGDATNNTTNTLDAHLLGLINRQNNDPGVFASFEILINKHRRAAATAGI